MVDEYLIRPGPDRKKRIMRVAINPQSTLLTETNHKITLHGHCYQKTQPPAADLQALGQTASAELLRAMGYEVEIIPSGCCGMAGAFGYEAEHYEVSMKVGELVLLPAVRIAKGMNASLVASGVSCRAQILDGAGVRARHPLEAARDALRQTHTSS
jgi:Fe-S oxidoreductase